MDRKRRVMAAKMLAATHNINTNKQNQLKRTKETFISNFCCSCVRLLVHRFTFSLLSENIHVKNVVMKIFFQIVFVWQETDLVLSYEFETRKDMGRFLFAHICRNSLFIICSLQNSSYCLLSTISGIFTINALLQQPCVPFHFDKQASFATSTPTNFCLQNHKWH